MTTYLNAYLVALYIAVLAMGGVASLYLSYSAHTTLAVMMFTGALGLLPVVYRGLSRTQG